MERKQITRWCVSADLLQSFSVPPGGSDFISQRSERFGVMNQVQRREDSCFLWNTGGVYTAELYPQIGRLVRVEEQSQRAIAPEFELARKTVRKMMGYSEPPGHLRQKRVLRSKLSPWQGVGVIPRQHSGRRHKTVIHATEHSPQIFYRFRQK